MTAAAMRGGDSAPGAVAWDTLRGGANSLIAEHVAPGVTRLSEKVIRPDERSFFYLVEGEERDCLIDGGWGFCADLAPLRTEPGKPLVAVATHSHFDHIGALYLIQECYGHPAEAAVFAEPTPSATQALPYLDGRPVVAGGGEILPSSIRQTACPLSRFLADGDRIDLGGRSLTVLHTPGHSPGSLSLFDADAGLLFPADTVHDGFIYDTIPGADPAALLASHERLAGLDFALALPGHGALLDRSAFLERIARHRRERCGGAA